MRRWDRLIACIRSGQLTDAQFAAEIRDPEFAEYYRRCIGAGHIEARPGDAGNADLQDAGDCPKAEM